MISHHEHRWRRGRLASRSARALTVIALAASLVSTTAATAYAEPDTTTPATTTTTTTARPTTAPADATTESTTPQATSTTPQVPAPAERTTASPTATASPTTTAEQPATATTAPSTTSQQVPVQSAAPDKSAAIASMPAVPPPSAAVDVEKPEREPGKTPPTGMDLVRAQQHALTVPADKLPELPSDARSRMQRTALPEGISQEDAVLAERMAMVANSNCQFYGFSPFAVCGAIRDKYNAMGGPASFLGLPSSPEYQNPGATGYRSEFLHGSIYWSAATGAHPVTPLYMTKWNQHGWEAGWMGYPTTDEFRNLDNVGSRQEFQHEGAAIYWNSRIPTPGRGPAKS